MGKQCKLSHFIFGGSKITADGDYSHEIKTLAPWKKGYLQTRQHIIKQRYYFANNGPLSQSYGYSSSHVWMCGEGNGNPFQYSCLENPMADLQNGLVVSPCSPRDSQESSPTPQLKSFNSLVLSFLYSPTLTCIHDYWKNHSFDYRDLCW